MQHLSCYHVPTFSPSIRNKGSSSFSPLTDRPYLPFKGRGSPGPRTSAIKYTFCLHLRSLTSLIYVTLSQISPPFSKSEEDICGVWIMPSLEDINIPLKLIVRSQHFMRCISELFKYNITYYQIRGNSGAFHRALQCSFG